MALVPSEMSLLQTFSVNKLLDNFSYDLIFPMELHGDLGSPRPEGEKRGKLQPLRTSLNFEEANHQFEECSSSTPSSVQSDFFSFSGPKTGAGNNNCHWYSSRPNVSQNDNFLENNLAFSPPKRYLSDSNLTNYPFGSASGDTSPGGESSNYSSHGLSSPFKNTSEYSGQDRSPGVPEYEPYHTRSAINLNKYNGPVREQKIEKAPTICHSDILNLLALNASNTPDSYMARIKNLEQTMRILQNQQATYTENNNRQNHGRAKSNFGSSQYLRQNYNSGDENMDFRHSSFSSLGQGKYNSGGGGGRGSNFSSCSSIDTNGHSTSSTSSSVRTWNGIIPSRNSKAVTYSQKVFLGGIPWETSEESLKHIFGRFGPLRVEWPGKDPNFSTKPKGCVYIIFENEKQVRDLLASCQLIRDRNVAQDDGKYFYKFPWKNLKTKNVEVIPWNISDSNYVSSSQILDPSKTIFVGALHGKLTAEGLAIIMQDLFDGVVYAGIDTDKHKYPLGAGRVTFNNSQSYMKAIQTGYLLIKTPMFTKKVQIDPYLEDNLCSNCNVHHGPYYCRELTCFRYFCRVCWQMQHSDSNRSHHRPLTRNSNKSQQAVFND